jgi:hypothetical protein
MARKPNYQFERMERDRAKAAKAAEKAAAKAAASQRGRDEATNADTPDAQPPRDED